MKVRTSVALATTASAATVATVLLAGTSDVLADPAASAAVRGATVAAWTLCGLHTLERRPRSRVGMLLIGAGAVYALGSLNALDVPAPFTFGSLMWPVAALLVGYIALAFPDGRLHGRASRATVAALAVVSVGLWSVLLLGARTMPAPARPFYCAADCPPNPFDVLGLSAAAADRLERSATGAIAIFACVALVVLIARIRATTTAARRVLLPPTLCLCAITLSFALSVALQRALGDDGLAGASGWLPAVTSAVFPFTLLLGQGRGRLFAAGALRDMVSGLSAVVPQPRNLEAVMAEALGDPSLRLAFPVGRGGFVDDAGAPIAVPGDPPAAVTEVRDERGLMATILHDPMLDEPSPGVVEAAGGAIILALENARLEADVRASARELRASRSRVLSAGVTERRRLERDLHDTAQQRLVALRIRFALARERLGSEGGDVGPLLDQLGTDVEATIDSVRVIGRSLYPPLLADRGLAAALTSTLLKAPEHLALSVGELGRSEPASEAAVYVCCRTVVDLLGEQDQLTVRVTHAHADERLEIVLACERAADRAELAAQALTQVRDHVGALGGRVTFAQEGAGWRINAAVPWPSHAAAVAQR